MAPKGENVLEWSDEMELAFIHIMLEVFKVTQTTSWKRSHWEEMTKEIEKQFPEAQLCWTKVRDKCARLKGTYRQFTELRNHTGVGWDADTNTIKASPDVWDMFSKKNRAFKAFRTKGCKHYSLLNELFSSSTATGALRISSTNPPTTSSEERRLHAAFISASRGKQKQAVNIVECSDESDDPVNVEDPIISESRRRVSKRASSEKSIIHECMELFRDSFNKNGLETPSASKRSKSVSSPDKPEKDSVNEAMLELKKLKEKVPRRFYVKAAMALADKEIRKVFMFLDEDERIEWLQNLADS
ncbi:uncharacterized protein LOC116201512 [Punica granatum]|uniref:Uncharacterized protein LOC116201512 n=1 Tax=Punica granatum TaxID=22663 RepID=A0A6P8D2H3_PUNGR|nr:uncharacterized protein LOC116201512 [Punica granatum]